MSLLLACTTRDFRLCHVVSCMNYWMHLLLWGNTNGDMDKNCRSQATDVIWSRSWCKNIFSVSDFSEPYWHQEASTRWRHQMETFSALLALCAGKSLVTGEFPSQRSVTRAFMFSMIGAWINGWVHKREAGYLRRHRAHYDVTLMAFWLPLKW